MWLIGQLMRNNVKEAEPLAAALLRWLAVGDRSSPNLQTIWATVGVFANNLYVKDCPPIACK